jgi:hypothetical protein
VIYLTGVIKFIFLLPEFFSFRVFTHKNKTTLFVSFVLSMVCIILLNSKTVAAGEEIKIEKKSHSSPTDKSVQKKWNLYTGIIFGTNYTANYQYNSTGGFSPNASLLAEYPFFKASSVALEFGYLQRKWEITGRNDEAIGVTTDFFNMQLNLRHRFEIDPVRPYLIFGLFLDSFLSGNFKSDGHEYEYGGGEYIEKVIFGTVWGIGSEYNLDKWGNIFLEIGFLIPFSEPLAKKSNPAFEQKSGFYQDYLVKIGYKYDIAGLF